MTNLKINIFLKNINSLIRFLFFCELNRWLLDLEIYLFFLLNFIFIFFY